MLVTPEPVERLASIVARMDAREGGHRHAAEALHLVSVAARARLAATPDQLRQIHALVSAWSSGSGAPSVPEMVEAIETVMRDS